jgi:hypothetical protein
MHNIFFIRKRFPNQGNVIVGALALTSGLGIIGGILFLWLQ